METEAVRYEKLTLRPFFQYIPAQMMEAWSRCYTVTASIETRPIEVIAEN